MPCGGCSVRCIGGMDEYAMNKIASPGIYDIPIEEYHGNPCEGPSISSSGLRTILLECPAKYWAMSPLNPNRFPETTSKALDIGRAAHALALGEPEFNQYFVVAPYDNFAKKPGYTWYHDEWKTAVEAGRESRSLIKPDDFDTVQAVAEVQKRSAQCMRAFEDGSPEKSLIWKDAETGIWLKSRPDWLPNKPAERFICEYKTAVTIDPRKWANAAFGYGYHMQAAMQIDAVKELMGCDPIGVAHVVQEKDPPYLAELRMFPPEAIEWGRKQYRRAIRIFAECLSKNQWPSYTGEASFVQVPYWVAKEMEEGWSDSFYRENENADADNDGDAHGYTGANYLAAG